jgi:ABC-type nitrate/sulfonate/bicarbonate transport system permease component
VEPGALGARAGSATGGPARGTSPLRRGDRLARWFPLALLAVGLTLWELASRAGQVSTLLYPPPSKIARSLVGLIESGTLFRHLAASLGRIASGALVGGGVGLLLGLGMGLSRRLRLAVDPVVAAVHPVPRLALLPLIFVVFGLGEAARIVVVAISCFFPMLISVAAGVRQIDPLHLEVARNFGARRLQVLYHVVLPGSFPAVAAGTRLSLISALRTTLGIELLAAPSGLGYLLWFSFESFNIAQLYAALLVVVVVGFATSWALQRWVARFTPRSA